MKFCLILQLIHWDDKNFYLEHEFISLTDGFVRAVVFSKQTVTGSLKVTVPEIIAEIEPNAQRPEMTKDLELWLNSMEESSQRYKKQRWTKVIPVFFTSSLFCYLYNIVTSYVEQKFAIIRIVFFFEKRIRWEFSIKQRNKICLEKVARSVTRSVQVWIQKKLLIDVSIMYIFLCYWW